MIRITVLDSHTAGEPTRLILSGFPELEEGSIADRKIILAQRFDKWRRATVLEPRGSDTMVGALLCTPQNAGHTVGVIFFNNSGYLGMCGHGMIGVVASLAYLGHIQAGQHVIETPVGNVMSTLHLDGSVSVQNVRSFRFRSGVEVSVPNHGRIWGDIAWGGNWFFLVSNHGQHISSCNVEKLINFTCALRLALEAQGIRGQNGAVIGHIELFADDNKADSKNFVLCPGKAYDRSPCGTGTSAKLACLAADGILEAGKIWKQMGIMGGVFEASYAHDGDAIIPTICGRAHITGQSTLLLQEGDPFKWGMQL